MMYCKNHHANTDYVFTSSWMIDELKKIRYINLNILLLNKLIQLEMCIVLNC